LIALDTNVLVRFLVQDDPVQSPVATRFIRALTPEAPGYVGSVVLAETSWVLAHAYRVSRDQLADVIQGILSTAELVVENAPAAWMALGAYRGSANAQFADALIARTSTLAGASEIVTFDRTAAAELGMRLLK
jgi:predicted nucleic-acid-binding protein